MFVNPMEVIDDHVSFYAAPLPTVGSESGSHPLTEEQEAVLAVAHTELRERQWLEERNKDWAIRTYGPRNIVEQDGMILSGSHPHKGRVCFTKSIEPTFLVVYVNDATPPLQRVAYSNIALLRHQFRFTLDGTEINPKLAADCMAKFVTLTRPPRPRTPSPGPSLPLTDAERNDIHGDSHRKVHNYSGEMNILQVLMMYSTLE
jgi:hypothetical protein